MNARSRRALVLSGLAALLVTPGAAGVPDVPDDTTPPVVTPLIFGTFGSNGWYRSNVTINWRVEDPESPILWWSGCDPTVLTTDTSGVTLACEAASESGRTRVEMTIKLDKTPPTASPSPSPSPNQHGWHRTPLTVGFVGSDAMSGPDQSSCTAAQPYAGPDTQSRQFTGTCKDLAGNTSNPSTYTLKYDATKPTATPSPSAQPNPNGWHKAPLTVSFVSSDTMSGPEQSSCTPPQSYSGPDAESHTISGTCQDLAGNTSNPSTYTIKYDGTPPSNQGGSASRSPDANGWYNHALAVTFQGGDATSPPIACTQTTYSGPDNANASILGTCTDMAGNQSVTKTFAFKYDAAAPQVTGVTPAPDPSGWYTQPIVFGFHGSDPLSGLDSCPAVTYDGPDGADASVIGICLDKAGNAGTRAFPLKYDDTGPAVTPAATRGPDLSGWYNHPLSVGFEGSDTASGLASCASPQKYEGPDSVFAVVTGTCVDKAGNVGLGSLALKYDSTAPEVAGASGDRAPDGNGWFNHPLTISFRGSDATSQIDACTTAAYVGPDNPSASIAGSCRDRAGNQSGLSAFAFKYDSTAPSLAVLNVRAGNRSATLTWEASPDTNVIEIVRAASTRSAGVAVYRGAGRTFTDTHLKNGVRYRYALTAYDEAHNATTREIVARPTAPLLSPRAGATVSAPPRLVWKAVERATYYNVQVWRGGKIFSAWPARTSLRLRRKWTYRGRRYRLAQGRYRWYVWPGYGKRAERRFGPLLGSSSFVVR